MNFSESITERRINEAQIIPCSTLGWKLIRLYKNVLSPGSKKVSLESTPEIQGRLARLSVRNIYAYDLYVVIFNRFIIVMSFIKL